MIKEFNIGDKVHLVPQHHVSSDYTFQMTSQMPAPKYEAIIKKKSVSGASKGKIAQKFDLPIIKYTLEFVNYLGKDYDFSYSVEMFKEFYELNRIDPVTLTFLETKTTDTTEDISTKNINDTESFTLNNNITIKF